MSLANKVPMPKHETRALSQASSFYEHNFETQMIYNSPNSSLQNATSLSKDPESPEKSFNLRKNFVSNSSSVTSTPSSTNSNNLAYNLSEADHSMISFINANGSLHGFEQTKQVQRNLTSKLVDDDYHMWEDDLQPTTYHSPNSNAKYHGLPETSGYGQPSDAVQFDWLNDQEGSAITDCIEEQRRHEASNIKRPLSTGESVQPLKKLCVGASSNGSKKPRSKSVSPCKDPQSSAAKNRRERISERLKTLQELVPNGSKVDLVTMLEKAIGYVQFLQLQVKVLATDEFWPAPGGKAPDLTQVKEAIDAILACQRGRNSSSTK